MIEDNDATDKKKHSWGLTIYAIFNPTRVYLTSADVHFMFSTKTKVVLNIISVVGFQWSSWTYSYGGSHCCVSPLELYTICIILPSLYAILVATLFAFLCHRGELRISPYLWGENLDSNSRCI